MVIAAHRFNRGLTARLRTNDQVPDQLVHSGTVFGIKQNSQRLKHKLQKRGGQFAPEYPGHFEPGMGGHFKSESGGQFERNLQQGINFLL